MDTYEYIRVEIHVYDNKKNLVWMFVAGYYTCNQDSAWINSRCSIEEHFPDLVFKACLDHVDFRNLICNVLINLLWSKGWILYHEIYDGLSLNGLLGQKVHVVLGK